MTVDSQWPQHFQPSLLSLNPPDLFNHNNLNRLQSTQWKLTTCDQNVASMIDQREYLGNKALRAECLSDFKNAKGWCWAGSQVEENILSCSKIMMNDWSLWLKTDYSQLFIFLWFTQGYTRFWKQDCSLEMTIYKLHYCYIYLSGKKWQFEVFEKFHLPFLLFQEVLLLYGQE